MRDRPRYFCYFVLLPFGRLPSALVQHVRQIHVVNAILLFLHSLLSSFTFSPTVHSPALADVLTFTYRSRLDGFI